MNPGLGIPVGVCCRALTLGFPLTISKSLLMASTQGEVHIESVITGPSVNRRYKSIF